MYTTFKPTHTFHNYHTIVEEGTSSWYDSASDWDMSPVFDEDAAVAYAEWRESFDYLLQELENDELHALDFGHAQVE